MAQPETERLERLERAAAARRVVVALEDAGLGRLIGDGRDGWGRARRVEIDGHALFVKSVPVTDVERDDGLPTANVYGIPPHLNYPFGSPGVAVGRELAFARRTTGWVETGACRGFPILVHDRVIDRRAEGGGATSPVGFSHYRHDDPSMNRYLADRAAAQADLVLVYEDIPETAVDRLIEHPSDAGWIFEEVRSTVRFLRDRDIAHFDVDLFNVVTDGRQAYLADHGLVMDGSFDLDDAERAFLADHLHFDEGNLVLSLGHQLYWMYRALPVDERERLDGRLGISGASFDDAAIALVDAVDDLHDGPLAVDPALRSVIGEHRAAIALMHDFAARARRHWDAHTRLDDRRLAQLLDIAG